ncbi:MAG TPA: ribosome maturation factor RimM [Candidatus Binatia bacterium]|jgi:16S rRNA processing protein RimM
MAEPFVPLGEIVTTHGLNGWLKLNSYNPDTTTLSRGVEVVLEKAGERSVHQLEASRGRRKQWLVKLQQVDSFDEAVKYVGSTVSISADALESLPPGQYYEYQVIGFEVLAADGRHVGSISAVMSTPGGDLLVVQGTDKEHLIPANREIVEKVDFTSGKLIINPPDGLLDL